MVESRNEVRDVSCALRCVQGVASEWEFIQTAPNQRPAWVLFGEGRADALHRSKVGRKRCQALVSDMEGWNEESCLEAQKCFVVEGSYETTCMSV